MGLLADGLLSSVRANPSALAAARLTGPLRAVRKEQRDWNYVCLTGILVDSRKTLEKCMEVDEVAANLRKV
jgi:hypothetical protein